MKYRIEKDTMGEVKVPKDALWGAQTQRALENFKISGIKFVFPFGRSFIEALGIIKYAAASSNHKLKLLDARKAKAIKIAAKMAVAELAINAASMGIAALRTLGKFVTNGMARETVAGPRRK